MGKKLYVGNLGPEASDDSLKALFSMFGTVSSAYIITDKQTGKGKGYGFVIMGDEAQARTAIDVLDGKKCGDFTVRVSEAKEKGK